MSDLYLRRKLTFHAHGRTLVLVKRSNEKIEHRLMMALLWALYLPRYPDLRVDVPIGARYRPDLVQLRPEGQPLLWAEAGEVGHWEILGELSQRAGESELEELTGWALPIQERHLAEVRKGSLTLASQEDID